MNNKLIFCSLLAFGLAGCAIGDSYSPPASNVDATWVAQQGLEQNTKTDGQHAAQSSKTSVDFVSDVPMRWWALLHDDELSAYLEKTALNNLEIKIAAANLEQARALHRVSRSAFWPQFVQNTSYTDFEQSVQSPTGAGSLIEAGIVERDVDFYTVALDASWEIDVFGGNRRRAEASVANIGVSIAQQKAVRLAALAETATAYFELRGAQQRFEIVTNNIDAQQRTVDVTRGKVKAGLSRRIDQLRAEAQLDTFAAQIPRLRAAIRASHHRLSVLTGEPPNISVDVSSSNGLPDAPGVIPIGLRAQLLQRRPDIIMAERRLAAATAQTSVAKADFFPRFSLNASYGFESDTASSIGDSAARTTALVPFVSWPFLQGGRLRANLQSAEAQTVRAALNYEKSVLVALADAETAISAYHEELQAFERLRRAASASNEAAQLAQKLYEKGLASFLTVLDAQQRRDQSEDQRTQSHTRVMLNLVRVYKALGGGWEA